MNPPGAGESRLRRNISALYAMQGLNYVFPLLLVPYLARVLGPSEWGALVFAQALGLIGTLVIEYGFNLSATREVARAPGDKEALSSVGAGVAGGKAALTMLVLVAGAALVPLSGTLSSDKILWISALFWAVGRGFTMDWLFLGVEQTGPYLLTESLTRLVATVAIFLVVKEPSDSWMVLALQGIAAWGAVFFQAVIARRWMKHGAISRGETRKALSMGRTMFVFRMSAGLYTTLNSAMLGFVSTTGQVAIYAGSERISKAVTGLVTPAGQAIFPRVSALVQTDRPEGARLARRSLTVLSIGGALLSAAIFILAPQIINLVLGSKFSEAASTLRILSLLPVLIGVSNVLGIQWMLPLGMDATFNRIILAGGLLNVTFGLGLAIAFGAIGTAYAVVVTEMFVTMAMFTVLRRKKLDPFTIAHLA